MAAPLEASSKAREDDEITVFENVDGCYGPEGQQLQSVFESMFLKHNSLPLSRDQDLPPFHVGQDNNDRKDSLEMSPHDKQQDPREVLDSYPQASLSRPSRPKKVSKRNMKNRKAYIRGNAWEGFHADPRGMLRLARDDWEGFDADPKK